VAKVFLERQLLFLVGSETKRMEMEEKTASKRRKILERELEWVRMAPKARQAKGKARLNSYDKLLNEDQKVKKKKNLKYSSPTVPVWVIK
jgi:ATPase subunit of ABC transporter with duplicated ATPase domains